MFEKFIVGAISDAIISGIPLLYSYGKRKKAETFQEKKVYFGVFGYRFLLILLAGIMSAESLLILLVGNSIRGTQALLLVFIVAIPISILYVWLYIVYYRKHIEKLEKILPCVNDTNVNVFEGKKATELNYQSKSIIFCSKCGVKLFAEDLFCTNCGNKVIAEHPAFQLDPIEKTLNFVDTLGWEQEISYMDSAEIYSRYKDEDEWSQDYRYLCYKELLNRQSNDN